MGCCCAVHQYIVLLTRRGGCRSSGITTTLVCAERPPRSISSDILRQIEALELEEAVESSKKIAKENWRICWICEERVHPDSVHKQKPDFDGAQCPHVCCPKLHCRQTMHSRWLDKKQQLLTEAAECP
mmetsp:Transcript_87297/g.173273  ORF Transcript_87297/g.173273 Transcript_87297/m.173273 type:complete len:128 (+) Transcript_87297:86-469(+)